MWSEQQRAKELAAWTPERRAIQARRMQKVRARTGLPQGTPEERFWQYVDRRGPNECWPWKGTTPDGYGQFWSSRKEKDGAHRVIWRMFFGDIPEGMFVCHRCDTRACVNPAHLFLGTPKDNTDDMMRKGRWSGGRKPGFHNAYLSKPCENEVMAIRRLSDSGVPTKQLAVAFGVTPVNIRDIVAKRTWKWL